MVDAPALAGRRWRWLVERGYTGEDREAFGVAFAEWFAGNAATRRAHLAVAGDAPVGMAWLAVLSRVPTPAGRTAGPGDVWPIAVPELATQGWPLGARDYAVLHVMPAENSGWSRVTVHDRASRAVSRQLDGLRSAAGGGTVHRWSDHCRR